LELKYPTHSWFQEYQYPFDEAKYSTVGLFFIMALISSSSLATNFLFLAADFS
jgi:hypothetical protein